MKLTANQIQELLNIIDKNQLVVLGTELGPDFLSTSDKLLLRKYGVDYNTLYFPHTDTVFTSFHMGMLAESLGAAFANKLTYDQLKVYIEHGDYIPLTTREIAQIESVKSQKFNDLKRLKGKIFQDVNQILINNTLKEQQAFLKKVISEGVAEKNTVREIANEIARQTGDWSRDFDRIVAYTSTLAYEEGKAAMIIRNSGDEDPDVYKTPLDGACDHCIRLYLTKGVGSQPIIFKLSKLKANGTNIGRKVSEWLAIVGPVHPYCRCPMHHKPKGYEWNDKKKQFLAPEKYVPKRAKIRAWIGGVEVFV